MIDVLSSALSFARGVRGALTSLTNAGSKAFTGISGAAWKASATVGRGGLRVATTGAQAGRVAGAGLASGARVAGTGLASGAKVVGTGVVSGGRAVGTGLASGARVAGTGLATGTTIAGQTARTVYGATGSLAGNAASNLKGVASGATTGGRLAFSLGTAAYSYTWSFFTFLIALLVSWWTFPLLLRIVDAVLDTVVGGFKDFSDVLASRSEKLRKNPSGTCGTFARASWETFRWFLETTVGLAAFAVLGVLNFIRFVWSRRFEILVLLFFTYFGFFVQQYVDTIIAGMDVFWDTTVKVTNVTFGVLNKVLNFAEVVRPYLNAQIEQTVEGLEIIAKTFLDEDDLPAFAREPAPESEVYGTRTAGRRLEEASIFDDSKWVADFKPVSAAAAYLYHLYYQFANILLKIFLSLFRETWEPVLETITFVAVKLACFVAGGLTCGAREILDFVLNLALEFFRDVFNQIDFLGIIPDQGADDGNIVELSCTATELERSGVTCDCAGRVDSSRPPGLYRNVRPCTSYDPEPFEVTTSERRSLVECDVNEDDGSFVERVAGVVVKNSHRDPCPHSRRSLTAEENVLNAQYLKITDCYRVCANGVGYETCHGWKNHSVTLLGPCRDGVTLTGHADARRRLAAISSRHVLDRFEDEGGEDPEDDVDDPLKRAFRSERAVDEKTFVASFRATFGDRYRAGKLACDHSTPWSYEPISASFHALCVVVKIASTYFSNVDVAAVIKAEETGDTDGGGGGRGRKLANDAVDAALDIRRRARTFVNVPRTNATGDVFRRLALATQVDDVVDEMGKFQIAVEQATRAAFEMSKDDIDVDATIDTRRRLAETNLLFGECPEGQELCGNLEQCVFKGEAYACEPPKENNVVTWTLSGLERVNTFSRSLNFEGAIKDWAECRAEVKRNPERSPFSRSNLFGDNPEALTCFPMIEKTEWRFQKWEPGDFKTTVATACGNDTSIQRVCACPNYFTTTFSYQAKAFAFVNLDFESKIGNALTSLQWVFYSFFFSWEAMDWWRWVWEGFWGGFGENVGAPVWFIEVFDRMGWDQLSEESRVFCFVLHLPDLTWFFLFLLWCWGALTSFAPLGFFAANKLLWPFMSASRDVARRFSPSYVEKYHDPSHTRGVGWLKSALDLR